LGLSLNRGLVVFMTIVMTACYGLLAGMGLPVQRALVMVVVGLSALHFRRNVPLHLVFLYALFLVTIDKPFSSLSAGYWLSFGAVASLIFAFSGRSENQQSIKGKIKSALTTQFVIFLMMSPLLIYWVSQFSIVGFIVNIIAIPFVALIIVPLLLLATPLLLLAIPIAGYILDSVHFLIHYFMIFIEYFGDLQLVYYHHSPHLIDVVLACFAGMILLFPKGLIPKHLVLLLFLPLFLPRSTSLESRDLVIKILDVGQGLSVLVQTKKHLLVYDVGPKYGNGIDAATRIVSPAIQHLGRKRIHTLIVSHGDSDHAGGLESLLRQHEVMQIFAGEPELILQANNIQSCHQGKSWTLDGIEFTFLNNLSEGVVHRNNKSCVLMIKAGDYRALLPGDIESIKEETLYDNSLVGVNLLIAPHHGSLTSSSPGFLNRLMPEVVVVSSGYNNKFGHPHERVTRRYQQRGMRVINTAESGEILVEFIDGKVNYESARKANPRFWYKN